MPVFVLALLAAQTAGPSGDWILPLGTTIYDTLAGPVLVDTLIIPPGATLRITGPRPFVVVATQRIQTNDFWGRKLDPATGALIVGELALPLPGSGGGAGGNVVQSDTFPPIPSSSYLMHTPGGGGGGGGLVVLLSAEIAVGATGAIRVDGGDGAGGEGIHVGSALAGSSGGGSGGMLILQADLVDLSSAGADALRAIGGIGGKDDGDAYPPASLSGGGNGGPGLIQIHVRNAAQDLFLPAGVGLDGLSAPDAHVCLPEL